LHRLRGQPSNRKFPMRFDQRVIVRVQQRYSAPTPAMEKLG
jgi:hypothetical protein